MRQFFNFKTIRLKATTAFTAISLASAAAVIWAAPTHAQAAKPFTTNGEFSVQVSPSPLVKSVEPGKVNELELQIRNTGSQTEALKIEPRSFKLDETGEMVQLEDTAPPEVAGWLSFEAPLFTLAPNQTFTQKVRVNVPPSAGFSYSFALVISRQKDPNPVVGNRLLKGSLAVFTLINVDKPGATRKLEISKFSVAKRVYEYLPANLSIQFKNTGNTIVQPYGNVFIQRRSSDKTHLSVLTVNDKRGYILPGTTRTLKSEWADGFPVYQAVSTGTDKTETKLVWNWGNAAHFRIGKYTAKIVAVYSDGQRDIPIEGSISFWVIPWKILLIIIVVILLILFSIGSVVWRAVKYGKRKHRARSYHDK